jgi:flagellar hook-associated protein 3 FlgL
MRTSYISTATLLNTPRANMSRIQTDLDKANAESARGRYADIGLELGFRTGLSLDLRHQVDNLKAQHERNALTSVRLDSTYEALGRVRTDGEAFLALTTPGKLTDTSASVVAQTAQTKLTTFIGEMNAAASGQYLFGGIKTGQQPIADFGTTPPSAAKTAFLTAFQAAFGFPTPGQQPQSGDITATQMSTFLAVGGPFETLFADPQWGNTWSSASSTNIRSEIARNETQETSVNANAQPLRQLAMLYTLGAEIGLASLSPAAQTAVYDKMRSLASSATLGVKDIQADIGIVQARLATVEQERDAQKNILTKGLGTLEDVDIEEVGTRLQNLEAMLKISYSLTSRVSKLSLMDYV